MDFTKLMITTGMTMKELKSIPAVALNNIIRAIEDSMENNWFPAKVRAEKEYQIKCYKELMLTAR